MEKSLFSRYQLLNNSYFIEDKIKTKLMKIYRLYSSSKKLWTEKNFKKLHLIANKYQ